LWYYFIYIILWAGGLFVEKLLQDIKQWAQNHPKIEGVILVGSCARGDHKDDSDIDLVLLTPSKEDFLQNQAFTEQFGTVARRQTEYYGACTSIRVWYEGGPEVEFGLVEPSWIARPLDAGTMQVLQGGYRVILDKKQRFPSCVPPPYTSPFNK
jgi:predicted nucleotidyltransferase